MSGRELASAADSIDHGYMDPSRQYDDFHATQLYCPTCRTATAVRERLLLVLPDGDLYQIVCARCGTEVGKQTRREAPGAVALPAGVPPPGRGRR